MKNFFFSLFLLYAINYSVAQSLAPDVISSSGNSFVSGNNQLDWTLGETVTSSLNNSSNLLTQGFHQNALMVTALDNYDVSYSATVFPNPTVDMVQIQFATANENNTIELYSPEGKLLLTQSSNYNALSQIDMSKYSNGTYLLKLKNKNSKGKTYQIVKLK
ncbi:MAG: T9SS type A sorting domain-containing protein [Bacteroidota bacterium]